MPPTRLPARADACPRVRRLTKAYRPRHDSRLLHVGVGAGDDPDGDDEDGAGLGLPPPVGLEPGVGVASGVPVLAWPDGLAVPGDVPPLACDAAGCGFPDADAPPGE